MKCFYCNEEAAGKDHIVPFSTVTSRKRKARRSQNTDLQVPACVECNSLLGANVFATMGHRMEFLLDKLRNRQKYRKDNNYGKRIQFLDRVLVLYNREEDPLDGDEAYGG